MDIKSVMEKAPVIDSRETVSKAISLMLREKKEAVVVLNGKNFWGVLTPRDLAVRNISNPEKTLVGKYVESVRPLSPDSDISEIINFMLINDYNVVPIFTGGEYFYISKLDVLAAVKDNPALKQVKASDVMRFPDFVGPDDQIAVALSLMKSGGVSSVPVVNKAGGVEGVVEIADILRADTAKTEKQTQGLRGMKSSGPKRAQVSVITNKNVPRSSPETPASRLADMMLRAKMSVVVVEKDGRLAGVIAPKMLLKLIGRDVSGVYVNISGIQKEDDFIKETIDSELTSELRKLAKIYPIQSVHIHIERHHDKEARAGRVKYAMKAKILTATAGGAFFAQAADWDITKCMKTVLARFEKEMLGKKGREQAMGRVV